MNVIKLLINNYDTVLYSSRLLQQKLAQNPSLKTISETHEVFIYSRFKPYVSLAFNYQKVRSLSTIDWNRKIQFSIPQYGDYIHDIVAHVQIENTQSNLQKIPVASPNPILHSHYLNTIPRNGYNWDNTTPTNSIYKLVDVFGEIHTIRITLLYVIIRVKILNRIILIPPFYFETTVLSGINGMAIIYV